MKEYTYRDLAAMQEEAKQRVMEMQKRSKYAVEDMNRIFERRTENENTYEATENRSLFSQRSVPVAQQPRNIQYPTGIVNSDSEKQKSVCERKAVDKTTDDVKKAQEKNNVTTRFFNVFGKLSREESEKMLILALCLLLSNEQADENLIMSLLYLIA
ncbi:MAG: hypothetical protein IKJ88_04865 [Clostridia bacterium]|nr:hypothetical protein [Clostridia bacterium]